MTDVERETEEIPWGGVVVDDTVISPDGREWLVTKVEADPASKLRVAVTMALLGAEGAEPVTGTPKKADLARIVERPKVLLSEALTIMSDAFPDATASEAAVEGIKEYRRNASECDLCGAWILSHAKHDAWHDNVFARVAQLEILTTRLAGGIS